jgi:hypothetical protein
MRNFFLHSVGWLPWVGGIVVVGVLGGVLGIAGVFGHPTTNRIVLTSDISAARTASAYNCPGGALVTKLQAHDKVLAVQRSTDSAYLGVRDPLNLGRVVWVRAQDVSVNAHQAAIATLPIGYCPEVQGILMPPTNQGDGSGAAPTTPTTPTKPTKPVPPLAPDTTAPTIGTPTAGTPVVCIHGGNPPYADTLSVTASDNVGVTSVAITWTGATTGNKTMTHSGSGWTFVYDVGTSTAAGTITFQLQARDAAGNLSSPTKVSITQAGCVG